MLIYELIEKGRDILYNIYCDESCHLPHDSSDVMVLGAMSCTESNKKDIFNDIRQIKEKHGLSSWFEIKWTKVSKAKVDFYKDLIDYFFYNEDLNFRGLIAKNKKTLNHTKYNQGDYNLWYYKMYFLLLDPITDETDEEYKIYIDIKDTLGGPRVKKLEEVLCNNIYDFKHEVIRYVKQINSKESEILQLTDILIGALSYFHRELYFESDCNSGKKEIIDYIVDKYRVDFSKKTNKYQNKFNIFIWKPRR